MTDRPDFPDRAKVGAVFVLPLLVLFGRILFGGQALFWGTPLLQFYPWWTLASAALRAGQIPLWNPYVGNGAPLVANLQSAVFYPPNWLYLLGPIEWLMGVIAVLHVLWAGLGMFAFARALGLRPFSAAVSGLSLMLSGYLIARLSFLSMTAAYAWLPWLLLAVERLAVRRRLADALLLGLMLGLQLLAGHAQTSFHSGLALAAYAIFRIASMYRRGYRASPVILSEAKNLNGANQETLRCAQGDKQMSVFSARSVGSAVSIGLLLGLAGLLGLGLAAIQLLPTWELMQLSQRSGGPDYALAMTYSFWPWRLLTLWAPNFFGQPASGDYWGYGAYWEDDGYMGVLPLLLALAAVLGWRRERNPRVAFFGGMALVALILALGQNTPVYPWLFTHVPGFGWFQAPARFLSLYTLAVAVLAGIGAEAFTPDPSRIERGERPPIPALPTQQRTGPARLGGGRRWARLGLIVGPALLIAGLAGRTFLPPTRLSLGDGALWLGAGLTGSALLARWRPRQANRAEARYWARCWASELIRWQAAALAFIVADLVLADFGLNPTVDASLYRQPTQTAAVLRAEGGRTFFFQEDEYALKFRRLFRFDSFAPPQGGWMAVRQAQLPNTGMIEGLMSANNFDPLLVGGYADLLAALEAAPDPTPLLRLMGVRTVISPRDLPGYERIYQGDGFIIYRVPDPLPRAYLVTSVRRAADGAEALALITRADFNPGREAVVEGLSYDLDSEHGDTHESLPPSPLVGEGLGVRGVPVVYDGWNSVSLRVEAPGPALLVLSDTYYPGWQAFVDGVPVPLLRANYAFRAVALSGGAHEVVFRYAPASFAWGGRISLISLIAVLGLAVLNWRRARGTGH